MHKILLHLLQYFLYQNRRYAQMHLEMICLFHLHQTHQTLRCHPPQVYHHHLHLQQDNMNHQDLECLNHHLFDMIMDLSCHLEQLLDF
jgi:hypothetical protein